MSYVIKSHMYESAMTALMWYATASDEDIRDVGGSLARVYINMKGTKAEIDEMRAKQGLRTTPQPVDPPILPRRVALPADVNAALGAVAEAPPTDDTVILPPALV